MFRYKKNSPNQSPSKQVSVTGNQQKNRGVCKYPHGNCSLLCLENYKYCFKHILADKSAPYKPCLFLYNVSGKKCGKPALRSERKDTWFCAEHIRKSYLAREKASSKRAPPLTQETLLASLSHYVPKDQSSVKSEENEQEGSAANQSSPAVNPFVDVDAASVNAKRSSQVLDYASDSDSDVEAATLDNMWRDLDNESSDAESVDSQLEDPLKHAGVYTAEEVTKILNEKMFRLQSLYIDQFRTLHHLLKERRRRYLHALKKEKETLCKIHDQEKTTPKEIKLYNKLKALTRFHKYYGAEAVLHKKSLERRVQVTEGTIPRTSHKGKCAFTEGGVKCGAKTIPVTKYCRKHILEDTQQLLFVACGFKRDDNTCQEPKLNIFENTTCPIHFFLSQSHNSRDTAEMKPNIKSEGGVKNTNTDEGDTEMVSAIISEEADKENGSKAVESVSSFNKLSNVENIVANPKEQIPSEMKPAKLIPTESPVVENNQGNLSESISLPTQQTEEEKMDTDSDSGGKEVCKEENAVDELVMVDMMTDVGVVEEVLESEVKTDQEQTNSIE